MGIAIWCLLTKQVAKVEEQLLMAVEVDSVRPAEYGAEAPPDGHLTPLDQNHELAVAPHLAVFLLIELFAVDEVLQAFLRLFFGLVE